MDTHRPFVARAASVAGAAALLAFSLAVSGCSHKYSSDDASLEGAGGASGLLAPTPGDLRTERAGGRLLFPLAVGNRWDYHVRSRSQLTTDAGPQPPLVVENPFVVEITGTETAGERTYFLESEFVPGTVPPSGPVFRVRESRFGLFELDEVVAQADVTLDGAPVDRAGADLEAYVDRSIADPGQRAAFHRAAVEVAAKLDQVRSSLARRHLRPRTGADPGEITMLSFPLFVGARWVVRDDPRFQRIVVARDRVNLPLGTFPAFKIRGTAELFGPGDRVFFWYSNLGLLSMRVHVTADAVDDADHVIGRVVLDQDQSLTGIHLVGGQAAAALVGGSAE
jgi:hypothetical protein